MLLHKLYVEEQSNHVICDATDTTKNIKNCLSLTAHKNFNGRCRFMEIIKYKKTIYQKSDVHGTFKDLPGSRNSSIMSKRN